MDWLILCFWFFGGGLVWWCTLEVESSDNVLLSSSGLDLLRLRKSTGVIGISNWHDVDSILRRKECRSKASERVKCGGETRVVVTNGDKWRWE